MNAVQTRALDLLKSFEDIQRVFAKTGANREIEAHHSFQFEQSNAVTCGGQAKDTQLQHTCHSNTRADLGTHTRPWAGAMGGPCRPLGGVGWHGGLRGGPRGGGGARQTSKSQSPAYLGLPTLGGAKSGGQNGVLEAAAARAGGAWVAQRASGSAAAAAAASCGSWNPNPVAHESRVEKWASQVGVFMKLA